MWRKSAGGTPLSVPEVVLSVERYLGESWDIGGTIYFG